MKLLRLNPEQYDAWNQYVEAHPDGTIFQTTKWLSNINSSYDIYTFMQSDQTVAGGIALVKTKQFGVSGYHTLSPSFTRYVFPLFGSVKNNFTYSIKDYNSFVKELSQTLRKEKYIDLIFLYGHQNFLPFSQNGFVSEILITHILKDKNTNEWLMRLNKNKVRELNKLLKEQELSKIIIHEDTRKDEIISLLDNTAERKSFRYNKSVLINLLKEDNRKCIKTFAIETVEHGFISAGVFAYDRKHIYNIVNASKKINHPVYKTVNLLTLYKGIEFALNNNRIFDFEGSMMPGVEEFYRLLGGEQQPIYRLYKGKSPIMLLLKSMKLIIKQYKG